MLRICSSGRYRVWTLPREKVQKRIAAFSATSRRVRLARLDHVALMTAFERFQTRIRRVCRAYLNKHGMLLWECNTHNYRHEKECTQPAIRICYIQAPKGGSRGKLEATKGFENLHHREGSCVIRCSHRKDARQSEHVFLRIGHLLWRLLRVCKLHQPRPGHCRLRTGDRRN